MSKDDSWTLVAMSESGKPIWTRRQQQQQLVGGTRAATDDDASLLRLCGLVQALRTSLVVCFDEADLGDIRSLRSEAQTIVFMTVGSITLLAVASSSRRTEHEAFLRLQLEFIYAQIIFNVTEQVQDMYQQNPALDLGELLGPTSDRAMRNLVDSGLLGDDNNFYNPAPSFTMGVETLFPVSPETRGRLSRILLQARSSSQPNNDNNTLFALLFCQTRLVTLVQPAFRPHQLRFPDLYLLLHFLAQQTSNHSVASRTTTAGAQQRYYQHNTTPDLWLPVCLPHLHARGFLHCYTHCLVDDDKDGGAWPLTLALLSSQETTEQLQIFRQQAARIRHALGLRPVADNNYAGTSTSRDTPGHATSSLAVSSSSTTSDEDYVDASGNGDGIIPYLPAEEESTNNLLEELAPTSDEQIDEIVKEYLRLAEARHFCFRLNVPILAPANRRRSKKAQTVGHLTQCLSSRLVEDDAADDAAATTTSSRRLLWRIYQRLSLRLRLGSATQEACADALDMIQCDRANENGSNPTTTIGKDCPAMGLLEAPPNLQGVAYEKLGPDTFFAMSGRDFEL